jgi:hypothetical protein
VIAARADVHELRVFSTAPWIVLLADAPLTPEQCVALGVEMSAAAGATIEVRPRAALPAWRRTQAWEKAVRLG